MELTAIKERLTSLGFTDAEDTVLQFIADSEENDILRESNQESIPEGFEQKAIDIVCGQYLKILKGSGKSIGIDIDSAVSSISEGDVSVSSTIGKGTKTPEQRFEDLIAYLLRGKDSIKDYRRIRW